MDFAALSMVMKQAQVKQQASISVMKSAMTSTEVNAAGLIDMLKDSTNEVVPHPYLGSKVDMKG